MSYELKVRLRGLVSRTPHNITKSHRDSFRSVFLLLLFEGELDEELLEFLVAVVDAKLLETVPLKNLKSVNIEKTDEISTTLTLQKQTDLHRSLQLYGCVLLGLHIHGVTEVSFNFGFNTWR